jgi:dihydropteroate synthase
MFWQTTRYRIELSIPRIMGIVNVTPDSFSDGGRHAEAHAALLHCERLLKDGAHVLDIGGESTRPGSPPVSLDEELARVLPVLRGALTLGVPISMDSYKPEVMRVALDLGVDILNDIWALRQEGAEELVASHPSCGVCLLHMHRDPQTMQTAPIEGDVVPQVRGFLAETARKLRVRGVAPERIVLDAGIGFGKTVEQNFALLARQNELLDLGYPWLAGWSRKSSLGSVTGLATAAERVVPSVAAALLAVQRGAAIVWVHDVRETAQALQVLQAMRGQETKGQQ